eukprot:Lithocolla_globosa_v1_NODE_1659_length_2410_cov_219.469691.p1 type:complete len:470 gc:universal NODE_1659_length_2410_cov_219.469691:1978-569(-)
MKLATSLVALVAAAASYTVNSDVHKSFSEKQSADLILRFPTYGRVNYDSNGMSGGDRRQFVKYTLVRHSEPFQAPVMAFFKEQGMVKIRGFWIDNTVLIRGASPMLFETLRTKFASTLVEIDVDKDEYFIDMPVVENVEVIDDKAFLEWGIVMIDAPAAWEITQGEGTSLATIDTGARYTHVALNANYRGNLGNGYDHDYNWHDPRDTQRVPFDNNGHGTHTTGTMSGGNGIGVAPESKWIAAKGCASSSCSTADLTSSFEYCLCPTRQDGSDPDCSQGVDVVSNSWGGGRGSSTYIPWIEASVSAGQHVIFSQGNSGSNCNTANSPGDLNLVIGVGSTDSNDRLSSFSSRGPGVGTATHPLQKPDVSAPGSSVRSAYHTGDTAYATLSGTSMACPHVAGVAGLMLSANPSIDYDLLREVISKEGETKFNSPVGGQTTCGGVSYDAIPNYHYGYSRLDANTSTVLASEA